MDLHTFRSSLDGPAPPEGVGACLRALWHAARDDWNQAHSIAQDEHGEAGSWVHAYLHRVEGDLGNAGYWYHRAGKPAAIGPLDEEWDRIVAALLAAEH